MFTAEKTINEPVLPRTPEEKTAQANMKITPVKSMIAEKARTHLTHLVTVKLHQRNCTVKVGFDDNPAHVGMISGKINNLLEKIIEIEIAGLQKRLGEASGRDPWLDAEAG